MDQVVYPNNGLPDTDEPHCCVLEQSLRNNKYNVVYCMMAVYFFPSVSSDGANCTGAL